MRMFSAARWRLTIVFTAVLVVILVTSAVVIYVTTRSSLFNGVDGNLKERAFADLSTLSGGRGRGGPDFISHSKTTGGYFYALTDPGGQLLAESPNVDPDGLAPVSTLEDALDDGETFTSTESSQGESLRVYVLAAQTVEGDEVLVQVGRSTEPEHSALARLRMVLLIVFGGSIVPAAVGGFLLSGRALRPIKTAMDSQQTFVADASHELRTPVSVVRTNAELLMRRLRRRGEGEEDAVAVQDILSESERLGKMVDQMLTLAQADAGQIELLQSDLSLAELAGEVGRSMGALAQARNLALEISSDGEVPIRGDPDRLRELLVVLVDNALKYTEPGGRVDVSARRTDGKAIIAVADTGPGIPDDVLPHIFERFYRADKARSRETGGTGLGLAIARQIAEAHGGQISVESRVGEGTTFTVELPAQRTAQRRSERGAQAAARVEEPEASRRSPIASPKERPEGS